MPDKNKFECTTKDFDNNKLWSENFNQGDATSAENAHICATGGQETACDSGFGEVVHFVDTCSTGAGTGVGYTRALENLPSWNANAAAGTDLYDVQTYPMGCNKHLRIRVAKAVSGQMMLKIVARSYNTAVDEGDPEEGYTYCTSKNIMFSVEAQVKPLTGALLSGLGVPSTGQVVVNEADSLKFFMNSVNAADSPFAALQTVAHTDLTDDASRFSVLHVVCGIHRDYVICMMAIDAQASVPFFFDSCRRCVYWDVVCW